MKKFDFPFPSPHPPEAVWEALATPLSPELNHAVNSPRVNLEYEGLSEAGKITEGTRLVYTPHLPAIDFISRQLVKLFAPNQGTGIVDSIAHGVATRTDLIESGQVAKGHMEYCVEEGEGETSVLIVRGEFVIEGMAEVIANAWPKHLGDINEWLVKHGIRNPAERFAEHVPKILAGQGS